MASLLSDKHHPLDVRISQIPGSPRGKALDAVDQLLIVLPKRVPASLWQTLPQGQKLKALRRRRRADALPAISTRLTNKRQTAVFAGHLDGDAEPFQQLSFARKLVAAALAENAGCLGILVAGFAPETRNSIVARVTAAALAAAYRMPAFKSKAAPSKIKSIRILGLDERIDLGRVTAEAEGNNLARFLTALPANKLDANAYVGLLKELAKQNDWQFRKYGVNDLEKMGAGAFLAVAQGNDNDSAAMVHLRYRPDAKGATPALTLVGKGIIFDTGGTNLKPFTSMLDMHIDMGGSAVAVGVLQTITQLQLPYAVDAWLAITENRTGPKAYKSQDVITAANGTTIQTIHTDAEGRLALADALVFACRDNPALLMDYATLTGACMNAVTTRMSGVFTNRPDLHPVLKKSGRESGERVWPFPIGKEFREELKSDTADIKQCAPNGGGDHILAGSFLDEFVDGKVPWVHVDLSACSRKGGLAHIPTDLTGFGVHFSMNFLIDQGILGNSDIS
jgi:leucyl aminopeptidase